ASPYELAQRIGAENLTLPAGRLSLGPTELTVRTLGEFRNVDEIGDLPIAIGKTGSQVRLREVATVTDGAAERRTLARLNGQDAIIVEIVKQPGSNTVQVADQTKARLAEVLPALGHDFKATLLIDQSELIRANADEVYVALFFGGAMAVLIILLFLLDPRGTFISSLALPTSVIGTFFVMFLLGYTLNQMTLLALSLAIGLLIDDAVVVREAITHRLDKGEEPAVADSRGTKEVGLAVLATTLALVAVFVPVAFMPGIVGQFFKQFGITISVAVLISLFISFTLDPMLSARLAKARKPREGKKEARVARGLPGGFRAARRREARRGEEGGEDRARVTRGLRGDRALVRAVAPRRPQAQVDLVRSRDRRHGHQLRRDQRPAQRVFGGGGPLAVHRRPAASRLRLDRPDRPAFGRGGEAPARDSRGEGRLRDHRPQWRGQQGQAARPHRSQEGAQARHPCLEGRRPGGAYDPPRDQGEHQRSAHHRRPGRLLPHHGPHHRAGPQGAERPGQVDRRGAAPDPGDGGREDRVQPSQAGAGHRGRSRPLGR